MGELTPSQQATRARFEGLIAAAAPFLDVVLGIGERISRIAEPTDYEYYPIRTPAGEASLGQAGSAQAATPSDQTPPAGRPFDSSP